MAANPELEAYKKYVAERLAALNDVFAKASIGDFSRDVEVPEQEDDFTEFFSGVQIMIEVIREQTAELQKANQDLEQKVAQRTAELEKSQNQLKSFLDNVPAIITIIDRQQNIVYVNHAIPPLSPEQVTGKNVHSFMPKAVGEHLRQVYDQAFQTGKVARFESRYPDSPDAPYFSNVVVPVKEGGQISSLLLMSFDVTVGRRAEEALKQRAAELEKLNQLMLGRELKMVELKNELERLKAGGHGPAQP